MKSDDRLEALLLRWEELAEGGEDVSVEDLCHDCPELAEELRRRIEALREMDWLGGLQGGPQMPAPGGGLAISPGRRRRTRPRLSAGQTHWPRWLRRGLAIARPRRHVRGPEVRPLGEECGGRGSGALERSRASATPIC